MNKKEKQERLKGIEWIDYVFCPYCKNPYLKLESHIKLHDKTITDFKLDFPNYPLLCENQREKQGNAFKGKCHTEESKRKVRETFMNKSFKEKQEAIEKQMRTKEVKGTEAEQVRRQKIKETKRANPKRIEVAIQKRKETFAKKSLEELQIIYNKISKTLKNKSPEELQVIYDKISKTKKNKSPEELQVTYDKISKTLSNKSPEEKQERRQKIKETKRRNPEKVKIAAQKRAVTIANMSQEKRDAWTRKILKASRAATSRQPNKLETYFGNLLQEKLPNEYKFVGDGNLIIGGKCPDFVNINGQKKLIEVYGDYWHRHDDLQDRINFFKQYGWETLVIWESEIKQNIEKVMDRVVAFNKIV